MKTSGGLTNGFTLILSTFLLLEGIWGLFSDVVFGVLTTNITHAIIHIILAIAGFTLASRHHARGFVLFVGTLLLVVGILRFIPITHQSVINLLNVNQAVAYLNITIGILLLIIAFTDIPHSKRRVID